MLKNTIIVLSVCTILATCTGCPRDKHQIIMERAGDGVRRTITARPDDETSQTQPPQSIAKELTKIYGPGKKVADTRIEFSKIFTGQLPIDLRHEKYMNYGHFNVHRSPLGESAIYAERLPEKARLLEVVRSATRMLDLTLKALFSYLKDQPGLADQPEKQRKLRHFLENEFRDDMLELALLYWLQADSFNDHEQEDAALIRIGLFLAERGYGDFETITSQVNPEVIWENGQRKAAAAMGYNENDRLPQFLDDLTPDNVWNAIQSGLADIGMTEDEYIEAAEPIAIELFSNSPVDTIAWKADKAPLKTNGNWDPKTRQVTWSGDSKTHYHLPEVLFAYWITPDKKYQNRHFGRELVTENLNTFNVWYESLSKNHRQECNAFLASMEGGKDLRDKLEQFQFSDTRTEPIETQENSQTVMSPFGIKIILDNLPDPKEPEKDPETAP